MSCFQASAMVEGSHLRMFEVPQCNYNVSLVTIYPVFAAHQVEWNIMGKTMPWWSVLSGEAKTTDISPANKAEFYRSGSRHISEVKPANELAGKRVLDFGCGLGRLAFAFANDLGASVTCVDQSVHHLKVAEAEWPGQRSTATKGDVEFVVSSPDLLANMGARRFDFIHSVIVLQHMVPALQVIYLEQFCDLLADGGTGWVQVPHKTDDEGCDFDKSISTGGLQMHHTPIRFISMAMRRRGCAVRVRDAGTKHVGGNMRSAIIRFSKREAGASTNGGKSISARAAASMGL